MERHQIIGKISERMQSLKRTFKPIHFSYETIEAFDNNFNFHPIVKVNIRNVKFQETSGEIDNHRPEIYQNSEILKQIVKKISSKYWSIYLIQN